jgi:hypothetical protein
MSKRVLSSNVSNSRLIYNIQLSMTILYIFILEIIENS